MAVSTSSTLKLFSGEDHSSWWETISGKSGMGPPEWGIADLSVLSPMFRRLNFFSGGVKLTSEEDNSSQQEVLCCKLGMQPPIESHSIVHWPALCSGGL